MVPACLMWLIWRKRNNRTFEDIVRSIDLLKPILVGTYLSGVKFGVLHKNKVFLQTKLFKLLIYLFFMCEF